VPLSGLRATAATSSSSASSRIAPRITHSE
jgi:hypothetical protein